MKALAMRLREDGYNVAEGFFNQYGLYSEGPFLPD